MDNDEILEECKDCEITYLNGEIIDSENSLKPEEPIKKWALRDRLRSRALWAAMAGLLITVLSAFNAWEYIGIDKPQFQAILTAIGTLLAAFGVFNDPTSRGRF